ncbi:MAG: diguanylate cyclase [Anaerolineaceae bacterium]
MDFDFQITQLLEPIVAQEIFPSLPTNQVIQMKIKELKIFECCVDQQVSVQEITKLFDQYPDWPGVIIANQNQFFGMLSRQRCFEVLGRPFGIEVFSKRTILEFLNTYGSFNLILDWDTTIRDAVKAALNREPSEIYEPIVVRKANHTYGLLNMHVLLLGQSDLLEKLYTEVQQLSIKDPLTNISNRRGFFEAAESVISDSRSAQSDLSALMIDIDNFKVTNDIYGHFVGDQVICAVADECKKILRQTDLLCRFGGEEFIALLPGNSLDTAEMIAERLRQKVEDMRVEVHSLTIAVTISIGVCHINDANGSLDTLLSQADQAMYRAKIAGRNQVMIWNPEMDSLFSKESIHRQSSDERVKNWPSRMNLDAAKIYDETIEGWSRALELRDKEMEGHSHRVMQFTLALAKKCGIGEEDLVDIRRGSLLHDIGKIAVPDPILFKPGPLSDEEWVVMRKHPIYAYEMLSPISFLQKSLDIPFCHHEHWDGSGYPRGLREEEIPLSARIFTIIDVWDALSEDRCYRPAWTPEEIRKYIIEQSGKLFDPNITPIFLELLNEISGQDDSLALRLNSADILSPPLLERNQCLH